MKESVLVWDLPTRAFHWMLAVSFVGAFATGDADRFRDLHLGFGYTVAGLVAFRVLWGLVGTRYARFRSFAFAPREVSRYLGSLLTPAPRHYLGHNPAASWVIHLMLGLALLAALTGYATHARWLGEEAFEDVHEALSNAMLALVLVHVAGVAASSFLHRENLARAMVDGRKRGEPGEGIRRGHWIVGVALVAAVAGFWAAGGASLVPPGSAQARESREGHEADRRRERRHHSRAAPLVRQGALVSEAGASGFAAG